MNLHAHADALNIPHRKLEQVRKALAEAKKNNADKAMASLMLKHGRLTEDARTFVAAYK